MLGKNTMAKQQVIIVFRNFFSLKVQNSESVYRVSSLNIYSLIFYIFFKFNLE